MNQVDIDSVPGSLIFQLENHQWLGHTVCDSFPPPMANSRSNNLLLGD